MKTPVTVGEGLGKRIATGEFSVTKLLGIVNTAIGAGTVAVTGSGVLEFIVKEPRFDGLDRVIDPIVTARPLGITAGQVMTGGSLLLISGLVLLSFHYMNAHRHSERVRMRTLDEPDIVDLRQHEWEETQAMQGAGASSTRARINALARQALSLN